MADRNFLSAFIKEDIYLIGKAASVPAESPSKSETYLVVTPSPLSDPDRDFLYKIFAAVQIPQKMLFLSTEKLSAKDYKAAFYFGTEPQDGSGFYQEKLVEQKPVIMAHQLSEIAADREKKKKLWTVLKRLFN
jgi:hypothetical protein